MAKRLQAVFFGVLGCAVGVGGGYVCAQAPSFTISATNVTIPLSQPTCSDGVCTQQYGTSTYTLKSVNGYAGAPEITCAVVSPPAGASLPTCAPHGPPLALPANGTVTGEILFIPPGEAPPPSPASLPSWPGRAVTGLALAAILFFVPLDRRRATRWFTLLFLAAGALAGLATISACGGGNGMTPGTYSYRVTATDTNAGLAAVTAISVTIP